MINIKQKSSRCRYYALVLLLLGTAFPFSCKREKFAHEYPTVKAPPVYANKTGTSVYRVPRSADFLKPPYVLVRPTYIHFINPHKNYPYYYKGQIHAHSKRSDGKLKPKKVLSYYRDRGYHFISLTDHDTQVECWQIFKNPDVSGITYIPGEEGGKGHRTHFLEVQLTKDNPCRPYGDFDLKTRNDWVEDGAGFTAAPHALAGGHTYTDDELFDTLWLRGFEIKGDLDRYLTLWDRLLRGDRIRWGICVDDFHRKRDVNKGWIMVNSETNHANRYDISHNLRNGNFYSVIAPNTYDGSHPLPTFHTIQTTFMKEIQVVFSGANRLLIIGRDGTLADHTGYNENDGSQNTITYPCNGSEGYVRIEIHHSRNVRAFSQPIFIYGNSSEDGIPVHYQNARIEPIFLGGFLLAYRIVDDLGPIMILRTAAEAQKALSILQYYGMNRLCFVGRPGNNMVYYTCNGEAPAGPYPGEDSMSFNPDALEIKLLPNPAYPYQMPTWKIVEGDTWLLDFDDSEIQARRSLEIIKRYGFTKMCSVDRPITDIFGMVYFRK